MWCENLQILIIDNQIFSIFFNPYSSSSVFTSSIGFIPVFYLQDPVLDPRGYPYCRAMQANPDPEYWLRELCPPSEFVLFPLQNYSSVKFT